MRICRPLTSPELGFQTKFCAMIDSGPDLSHVLHLCSPCQVPPNQRVNTWFLENIKRVTEPATFPRELYFHGIIKKTLLLSEEPFKVKDGQPVMSGLCLGLGVWGMGEYCRLLLNTPSFSRLLRDYLHPFSSFLPSRLLPRESQDWANINLLKYF